MIHVVGPRDPVVAPEDCIINTTSRSTNWSRDLSPFFLGPCELYEHEGEMLVSQNMENAWQYSKVYNGQGDNNGPFGGYFDWAKQGWEKKRADRYPMGKGAVPMYSYWNGDKLDYIEARKKIYAPLYAKAVEKTTAYSVLENKYKKHGDLYLWDFDAYYHHGLDMSFEDVINNPKKKMGHAFVLAMMLMGERVWE